MVGLLAELIRHLRRRLTDNDGRGLVARPRQTGLAARLDAQHVHLWQADTQLHARIAAHIPAQRLALGHVGQVHGGERLQIAERRGMQARGSQGGKGGEDTGGKDAAGKREWFHQAAFRKSK